MNATIGSRVQGMTVEPKRLARARALTATKIGESLWLVTGGEAPHHVNLNAGDGEPICDCEDAKRQSEHNIACKHTICTVIAHGLSFGGSATAR